MKLWIKRILDALRPSRPFSPWPAMGDEKTTAARYARGNILLATGRMQTVAEYEAQKRRVLSHAF